MGGWNKKNYSFAEESQSGILGLEAYTDEDWEKYGDNIATERFDSPEYWKWVEENCYEEHIRRLRNYVGSNMQQDTNIDWIQEVNWVFDAQEYKAVVEQYRELKLQQDAQRQKA